MHSTLKPRESDPHDVFAIEPDIVPLAWADKVLADIARGNDGQSLNQRSPAASAATAPAVDTTFCATNAGDLHVANDRAVDPPATSKWAKSAIMLVLTLCSAAAAAGWQHYGDAAKQMISNWTPAFAQSSSPPEPTGLAAQAATPAIQAAATDPAASPSATQPPESAAPAAAAPASDTAQLQSMARDLTAMGRQIAELKASLAELKASQPTAARPSEARSSDVRPAAPNPRPKISAPPLRSAAAHAHRPMPAYVPAPATAPPSPLSAPPPVSWQPAPPPQAATEPDGEPVMRPPMPLR